VAECLPLFAIFNCGIFLFLMQGVVGEANAASNIYGGTSHAGTVPHPSTFPAGSLIGGWFGIDVFVCSIPESTASFLKIYAPRPGRSLASGYPSIQVGSNNFPVYSIPGRTDIGYILADYPCSYMAPGGYGSYCALQLQFGLSGSVNTFYIRLVKTSDGSSSSSSSITFNAVNAYLYDLEVGADTPQQTVRMTYNFTAAPPPPPPQNPTCTTPYIPAQAMAPVQTNQFPWVGIAAGGNDGNDFTMQFTNCVNKSKILYRIQSSGTSPNASQGLLPLISPSTASGLAVQVLASGSPVPLNSWRTINTSASSYSRPMRVRYYRTGNLVPGSVHAAMTISFQYQ